MLTPLTPMLTANTASSKTASVDAIASSRTSADDTATVAVDVLPGQRLCHAPHGGGRDAGGELGQRRSGRQRRETDLCVPDLQVKMRNEGKSYYYYTTTYH